MSESDAGERLFALTERRAAIKALLANRAWMEIVMPALQAGRRRAREGALLPSPESTAEKRSEWVMAYAEVVKIIGDEDGTKAGVLQQELERVDGELERADRESGLDT